MKLLLLYILFSMPVQLAAAQDTLELSQQNIQFDTASTIAPVVFNKERIERFKNEKSFDYLTEETDDTWWTRFKKWVQLQYEKLEHWLFGDYKANVIIAFLLKVIPYIIIGAILGLIIWLFIRLNPGPTILGETQKSRVVFNEEEKIVRSQNIDSLIEEALRDKNYRLAVRYYYLRLLKQLNEKELIIYQFQKTNSEYLSELEEETFKQPLKSVMRIYDFIWYGSFSVSETDFLLAQKYFQDLESSLNKLPNG